MINLADTEFTVFFTPNVEEQEKLRIFTFDEHTGHFQAAMEPESRNVYGVFSSSGRIEFTLAPRGDNVFQHFIGALKSENSKPLWMAGTSIKFTVQTVGQQNGKSFVIPFYAVQSR